MICFFINIVDVIEMVNYICKSPVLFLIFNRPEETRRVFDRIKEVKPSKLYIAADGPRKNKATDIELCQKTQAIVSEVDWDCDVKVLFHNTNHGCKIAVSTNITWFFENEVEGIILEDDCLPSQQFFEYCDILLDKYRDDTRIRHISGSNLNAGKISSDTYYFSKLTSIWGWASWRRVWKDYDVNLTLFDKVTSLSLFNNIIPDKLVANHFYKQFKLIKQSGLDTWDYQYVFCNMINNGLCIQPNYNMISNIGFNKDATHTHDAENVLSNLLFEKYDQMVHPDFIIPNVISDIKQVKKYIPSPIQRGKYYLKYHLKKIVVKLIKLK